MPFKIEQLQHDTLRPRTRYIAFNALVDGRATCIAFTLGEQTWSFDTGNSRNPGQPHDRFGDIVVAESIVFSASALGTASQYLQVLTECAGAQSFTAFSAGTQELHDQLRRLHEHRIEILKLQDQLAMCVDTNLHRNHRNYVDKHKCCDDKKAQMNSVLEDLCQAVKQYEHLPRLVPFSVPAARGDAPIRRGAMFTRWAMRQGKLAEDITTVAEEIKPLHMARFRWVSEMVDADQRRLSIDLVGAFEGRPVVMEVKMQNDSWTFESLPQLLCYGAMVTPKHQRERFRGLGINKVDRLWLGLVTETRMTRGYSEDYDCAICWFGQKPVKKKLAPDFAGIFVLRYREAGQEWKLDESTRISFQPEG